jgi:hypothetical protein
MKKSIINRLLILVIVFLQGNLFLATNSLTNVNAAPAPNKKYDPEPISCRNDDDEVIAYGSTCVGGDGSCTPNDCP